MSAGLVWQWGALPLQLSCGGGFTPCAAVGAWRRLAHHLIRLTAFGTFPSRGRLCPHEILASPRGEAVGGSRLMRWQLMGAGLARQWGDFDYAIRLWRGLFALRCGGGVERIGVPPHPSRLTPCHLPLEGKAFAVRCFASWGGMGIAAAGAGCYDKGRKMGADPGAR